MKLVPTGEYAADWPEISRATKDAAGWRCVRCNHLHDREGWYILTVHHLDGNKANNVWWNLLALCQRCHLTIQGRVVPERPWLFEHSAWFKPYVAGFYAKFYGGEDITREQAEAELDRWLTLGQPWLVTT